MSSGRTRGKMDLSSTYEALRVVTRAVSRGEIDPLIGLQAIAYLEGNLPGPRSGVIWDVISSLLDEEREKEMDLKTRSIITRSKAVMRYPDVCRGGGLAAAMARYELDLISRAMAEAGGNISAAARSLKMNRTTLSMKLKKIQEESGG